MSKLCKFTEISWIIGWAIGARKNQREKPKVDREKIARKFFLFLCAAGNHKKKKQQKKIFDFGRNLRDI